MDGVVGDSQGANQQAGANVGPQLIVNAQYIKHLTFESPRSPHSLTQQAAPPSVEANINVTAQGLGPENYEVMLKISGSVKSQDETLFLIELSYGAVVTARNLPQEAIQQAILVETPRVIFPFARNIIATTTRD